MMTDERAAEAGAIGCDLADRVKSHDGLRLVIPNRASSQSVSALQKVRDAFRRWLGEHYDLDAIHAVLATAAAERLTGDPAWLLVISGPGNAKTEPVQALAGAGAIITSTISSEGALLSGTPIRDKGKDATGGLLRRIGDRGVLVVKDMTSILSMHRDRARRRR